VAQTPPGLNHVRAQDSLDQLRARLGQEQFEQVITSDGAEAEIATPPVRTQPGFPGELRPRGGSLASLEVSFTRPRG